MSKDKYIYFIYQDLQGDLSPADQVLLQAWLAESADNQAIQSQIQESIGIADRIKPDFDIDVESDYANIADKLGFNASSASDKASKTRRLVIYASVLVLGISLLFYLFSTQNTPAPTQLYAETGIGETKNIELADGSVVVMNEKSSFEYPSSFIGESREVTLKGEAYFDIAKSANQTFTIETEDAKVSVLGTAFNVDAYAKDREVIVTVQRGKVSLSDSEEVNEVFLTANEEGKLVKSSRVVSERSVSSLNALAWKSKELSFKNATLEEVFTTLESVFNVKITSSDSLNTCRYSMTKQKVDLKILIAELSEIYNFKVESSSDKNYTLTGGSCE